jgi:hypothetical protein
VQSAASDFEVEDIGGIKGEQCSDVTNITLDNRDRFGVLCTVGRWTPPVLHINDLEADLGQTKHIDKLFETLLLADVKIGHIIAAGGFSDVSDGLSHYPDTNEEVRVAVKVHVHRGHTLKSQSDARFTEVRALIESNALITHCHEGIHNRTECVGGTSS